MAGAVPHVLSRLSSMIVASGAALIDLFLLLLPARQLKHEHLVQDVRPGARTLLFFLIFASYQCPSPTTSHFSLCRFCFSMPTRCSMKFQKGFGRIDLCKLCELVLRKY
jgi:hypothetical protein